MTPDGANEKQKQESGGSPVFLRLSDCGAGTVCQMGFCALSSSASISASTALGRICSASPMR